MSYAVWRVTGITVDKRYSDQLTKLFTNAAAGIMAAGTARISATGVDVHSASLKEAADKLIGFAPNAIAHFGLTPQDVADRIVQKIPQLPAATAPIVKVVPPAGA